MEEWDKGKKLQKSTTTTTGILNEFNHKHTDRPKKSHNPVLAKILTSLLE